MKEENLPMARGKKKSQILTGQFSQAFNSLAMIQTLGINLVYDVYT